MNLVDSSLEARDAGYQADARDRALVDVAGPLASHAELSELLATLRGQLEPLVAFEYLAIGLRDGDADSLGLRLIAMREREVQEIAGDACPFDGSYTGLVVCTGDRCTCRVSSQADLRQPVRPRQDVRRK